MSRCGCSASYLQSAMQLRASCAIETDSWVRCGASLCLTAGQICPFFDAKGRWTPTPGPRRKFPFSFQRASSVVFAAAQTASRRAKFAHFSTQKVGGHLHDGPNLPIFRRERSVDTYSEAGSKPKYIVSDKGPQFRDHYRGWCASRNIKPRFGAVGQHGSIAVVERFIRTLKTECTRCIVISLILKRFEAELSLYLTWYNEHRPHSTLHGRTPSEVSDGRIPARDRPPFETRARAAPMHRDTPIALFKRATDLRLVVTHLEGRRYLPIVTLKSAA